MTNKDHNFPLNNFWYIKILVCCFFFIFLTSCSGSHEVTTWNEWCDHGAEVETYGHEGIFISYNLRKIREDFINDYNEILVEELVSNHFWDETIHTNEAAENLINNHKLGLWVTGNQLHFANTHLSHEQFEGDVERFKTFLSFKALENNKYHLNHFQICLYETIDEMFESFVIHTKKETHTIQLDFLHKAAFTGP